MVAVLGKTARDVSLLMQREVGEASEAGGVSSTMPHKRNPAGCAIVLAAATRAPGLVASFLTGMVQEHERSLGGWHAEWPTITDLVQTTGATLAMSATVAEELTVDPDRMRMNIDRTNGAVFSEQLMMLLAPALGRDRVHRLISDAMADGGNTGRSLTDIVSTMPEATGVLTSDQLERLGKPGEYLGLAEVFRRQLLIL